MFLSGNPAARELVYTVCKDGNKRWTFIVLSPVLCFVHYILKARQHFEGTDFVEPFKLYFSICYGCWVQKQILSFPIPFLMSEYFRLPFALATVSAVWSQSYKELCCILVLHSAPSHPPLYIILAFHTHRMSPKKYMHTLINDKGSVY